MIKVQPKILVISHNCFSEVSANGRTLSTFFRRWDINKVSQIYINDEVPDSTICKNFYRITDKDILNSLKKTSFAGGPIKNLKIVDDKITDTRKKSLKKFKSKIPSLMYIARNLLWSINVWNNKNLETWIDNFKPDIVLLQPGDYSFVYKMARLISKNKSIPLIIYNSEDYYLKDKFSLSPLFHIQRFFFKKEVKTTLNQSQLIIFSNDLLERTFKQYIKTRSAVILTSSEIIPAKELCINNTLRFVYAGNLGHERWKSLLTIASVVKEIDSNLLVDVYSSSLPLEAEKYFTEENGIRFNGGVSYLKVMEIINESDLVIHAEGFSNFTRWDIKHGFSTKIADLLSSGKSFLMYGPKEIACVNYLIDNKAAWVATNEDSLRKMLYKIIKNKDEREKYLENAQKLVLERHNVERNCKMFENLVLDVYNNYPKRKR